MTEPALITFADWEDSGATLMARVKLESGYMLQEDIDSISVKCTVEGTPATETGDTTPAVDSVVYDSLQRNWPWQADQVGYNFRYAAPPSFFPEGDVDYLIEIKFSRSEDSGDFHIVFKKESKNLQRS